MNQRALNRQRIETQNTKPLGAEGDIQHSGVNRRALKETQPGTAVIEPNGDETH
jgi:hypothetical protein